MRASLKPGSEIPEVVVPFDLLQEPVFYLDDKPSLLQLKKSILVHNTSFENLGLKYMQDVITREEEKDLIHHTLLYMQVQWMSCGR